MPGLDLRPTSDRLRETLFNVLCAGNPSALEGSVWVDLYAGTGAVGIEALSRGAGMVYFVESSTKATELINQNLQSLKAGPTFEVLKQDAVKSVRFLAARNVTADFVFLDPPYRMESAYSESLTALGQAPLLKANGLAIAEHDKRLDPGEEFRGLRRTRKLEQGDSALSFYQRG
jgi:16S rRNA (guanine966-N2)-methyltransferase